MTTPQDGAKPSRIAVIGAGSWGTALAVVAARNGHKVTMWAREAEVAASINTAHRNPVYLSTCHLPDGIRATVSLEQALEAAEIVLLVVPSHALRDVIRVASRGLGSGAILVSATKGVENDSLMRMTEVIVDVLGGGVSPRLVVLSGPSFAFEVARGDPTAIVAASSSERASETVQFALSSSSFRVYTNPDVIGVELGGAVKNVVAIASGVVRGLDFGANSVAAIVTRGLAEMTRLAQACGARVETLSGLAGLGDLVLTCTGDLSRNRHVGFELGRGRKLADILGEMREVAEGVRTTKAIHQLSVRMGVEMPITASVHSLLHEGKTALEAAAELMDRPLKHE